MSVDTDLLVRQLRRHGHTVEGVIKVPDNAGDYEFIVDGATLTLEETRVLLERDQTGEAQPLDESRTAIRSENL